MSFAFTTVVFLIFRFFDWLISYLALLFIPYLGFFPYKEIALGYNLPKFLTIFANFDGAHYLLIAKQGYMQYQQAFFPLYPLLIRWLSPIFLNNYLLTGLFISNFSFILGLIYLNKYLIISKYPISNIKYLFLFLIVFPTSFFFGALYTEGLFFLLFIGTLYFLKKENYFLTAVFAFLASLTRLIGIFLIIPIFLSQISNLKSQIHILNLKSIKKFLISNISYLISLISPILGLALYSLYLWQTTGDPLFFLHSQWAFGANRTSRIILLPQVYFRYFKIFFTANWNFQYFISLFEFAVFNFVFIIVILNLVQTLKPSFWGPRRKVEGLQNRFWTSYSPVKGQNDRLGLDLFSLINLLLPTLTGTLSSIPRYALFSLSFFIYLSQIKNFSLKLAIAIIFVILHVIMLGFFTQGYFVS